jgi:glucosyl-dolichyl phosphate glucuronosyltransferase
MKVTVILCTYNRCATLAKALESIAASIVPEPVDWEVLVVDNNSMDQTYEVVEELCRRFPGRFRYLVEPQQGKSYALNTGIREARGDVVALTDDDVTVDPLWLQSLTAPLVSGKWAGAGGRTLAERSFTLPCWLSSNERHALGPLSLFDRGPEACELTEVPFGNNMAFRREIFEKYGGFRTDLGPCPGTEIRGEDSEFGQQLLDAGERLRYEPMALVYHQIHENRLRKSFFLAWWFDKARADFRRFGLPGGARWHVGGVPLCVFHRLARWTLQWMVSISASRRFCCKRNAWYVAGTIRECRRLRSQVKPNAKTAATASPGPLPPPDTLGPALDSRHAERTSSKIVPSERNT